MGQDRIRAVWIREIHAAVDELDDTPIWRSDSDRDDGIPAADDELEVE